MRQIGLMAVLGLTLSVAPSPATTALPVSVAPYTALTGDAGSAVGYPCTTLPSPVAARSPNATTGRMDGSEGVAVTACALAGRYTTARWTIAKAPDGMAGKRAAVLAYVQIDAVQGVQTGTGKQSAAYKISIGGKEWTVLKVTCEFGCHHSGASLGVMLPLGVTFTSLPETIEMLIHREASIIAHEGRTASGSIGVDVKASLVAVLIHTL